MTQFSPSTLLRTLLGTVLILSLAACETAPEKPQEPQVTEPVEPEETEGPDPSLPMPASEYDPQFAAAEAALARFSPLEASTQLVELAPDVLSANDEAYLNYLLARIEYQQGELEAANQRLDALSREVLHPAMRAKLLSFQRHKAELAGDYLRSAQLALETSRRYPDRAQALRQVLWQDIARLSPEERAAALAKPTDAELRAYLQLAEAADARGLPMNPARLLAWQQANPQYASTETLPGGLAYLLDQPSRPTEVALILPLTGRLAPAAKAVRDGYLAAFYRDRSRQGAPASLTVLDSTLFSDSRAAYQSAVAGGADLVIGPLSKQAVADLAMLPDRPVPILALNRIDQDLPQANSALVQLSLAPEDEAARIAELAFGQGARRALLVRPEGTWGDKMEKALRGRFQPLGGTVASTALYNSPEAYSSSIEASLGIPDSKQRSRDVRSYLATNIEFTARRRQDVDAIFLIARNSAEARSIKPLLAFHYAGDLPVWGTSSAYSGTPDTRDRDLNGMQLVEMPWLLENRSGLQQDLASAGGSRAYTRLNALGADAYLVQRSFSQLQAGADALVPGSTGLLYLDPGLRLKREPSRATFDRGEVRRP